MTVASLVDTNILVYRVDTRFPRKQRIATELLRTGIAQGSLRVPHQAIVEFVAANTRARMVRGRSARHERSPDTGNMTSRCDRHALETR